MSRFAHQQAEYDAHRYDEARAYLWQMRTGKSRMAVESARALHEALEINGVLVIAPNGVHRQWAEEQVDKWGGGLKNSTFAWRFSNPRNAKEFEIFLNCCRDRKLLHWMCVNMEALIRGEAKAAIALFKKAVGRAMLIVDESHHFGRAGAKRTAVARGLAREFEYRRILTGTPFENSPRRAFPQFEILRRGALGHVTQASFDGEFVIYGQGFDAGGRRYPKVEGYKNLDALRDRIARCASVVLRKDCADLPPIMRDRRVAEMEGEQLRWWNAVRDKELEECEKLGHDRIYDGGAALVKLQQIEGGYWLKGGKPVEIVPLDQNPKMLILLDEIEQYDGQVIAWFEYTHEIEAAEKFLAANRIMARKYHGKVPVAQREKNLAEFKIFRGSRGVRVLLAQPRAGGEGRDMSAAGKIIWYSHTPDATVRAQADERATAMGGSSVQIVDIVAPVGDRFVRMTEKKSNLADELGREGLRAVLESLQP